jgi:tetratricopeptide (TPR) repeat protein
VFGLLWQVLVRVLQSWFPSLFKVRAPLKRALHSEAATIFNRLIEYFILNNEPLLGVYCGVRNMNLAVPLPPSREVARGYAFMSLIVWVTPMKKTALAWSLRGLAIAEQLKDPSTLSYCLARTSNLPVNEGDWTLATERLGRGIRVARDAGDNRGQEECQSVLAFVDYFQGRFEQSLEGWRRTLQSATLRGDRQTQAWGRAGMAMCLIRLGREEEALAILDEGMRWVDESGTRTEVTWSYSLLALARLRAGDAVGALAAADKALDWIKKERLIGYFFAIPAATVPEVYLSLWESAAGGSAAAPLAAKARSAVAILAAFSKMYPFGIPSARLLRGRQKLLDGHAEAAARLFDDARLEAERREVKYEAAVAHQQLALAVDGEAREAHLREAATRFADLGCRHDLLRVRSDREHGARAGAVR